MEGGGGLKLLEMENCDWGGRTCPSQFRIVFIGFTQHLTGLILHEEFSFRRPSPPVSRYDSYETLVTCQSVVQLNCTLLPSSSEYS